MSGSYQSGRNVQYEPLGVAVYTIRDSMQLHSKGRKTMKRFAFLFVGTMMAGLVCVTAAVIAAPASSFEIEKSASGGGHYLVGGSLDVQFAFSAVQYSDGHVAGSFHDRTNDGFGVVDFDADVTCLAVDRQLGRAWIGGVITANLSTSPDFTGGVYQPGHDIWFRVLDSGHEEDQQDRRTFVGFEGAIPSSAAYCATRPWAPDNARTWPVTSGNITVGERGE
jgi:hypothetical protein